MMYDHGRSHYYKYAHSLFSDVSDDVLTHPSFAEKSKRTPIKITSPFDSDMHSASLRSFVSALKNHTLHQEFWLSNS